LRNAICNILRQAQDDKLGVKTSAFVTLSLSKRWLCKFLAILIKMSGVLVWIDAAGS
jgi:hypothetical protein